MSEYVPTIGLEIHAELRTKSKMFCNSKNDTNEKRPNVNICPVCLAHPGTLPVINGEAVRHVLRVGLALGGKIADYTEFDRKNYFYPDLPKGYQISQYEYPLVRGGVLKGVAITRIHLEEDTASSTHDQGETTLIDFNRAGVPLMELVTEPVIQSAEEAGKFARELQLLLRTLGASSANMEKGEMRVEANISVSKKTKDSKQKMGTKIEIKNLNSFRAMERAVAHEIKRQTKALESGEKIIQETRGWDEGKQTTFAQRTEEGSADYRYFPDPDLPSLRLSEVSEFTAATLHATLPELPEEKRRRYRSLGVKSEDVEGFVRSPKLGAFFEAVVSDYGSDPTSTALAANYVANDLVARIRDTQDRDTEEIAEIPISAHNFKKIIDMLIGKRISSRAAKHILVEVIATKGDPEKIAKDKTLFHADQEDNLEKVIDDVIAQNQASVADFRSGKVVALEYLVGQSMRALKGAADPVALREHIRSKIGG